jgi:hypothetical protein
MSNHKSRPKRWAAAAALLSEAVSSAQDALAQLEDLKSEYQDWHDGLPENLASSPVAEKLEAIIDLDFESAVADLESLAGEIENIELPLGFGRD